jgi:hypothetical protein
VVILVPQAFGPVLRQTDRATVARLPSKDIQILFSAGAGAQLDEIIEELAINCDALLKGSGVQFRGTVIIRGNHGSLHENSQPGGLMYCILQLSYLFRINKFS